MLVPHCRAVANGPVGPAMAGPIIEPAIKKNINVLNFLIFSFFAGFGRNNKWDGIFFRYSFWTVEDTVHTFICTLAIRFACSFCPSHNMDGQAVINIRCVGEAPRCTMSSLASTASLKPTVTTECDLPVEPTSKHVSRTVLQYSWEH